VICLLDEVGSEIGKTNPDNDSHCCSWQPDDFDVVDCLVHLLTNSSYLQAFLTHIAFSFGSWSPARRVLASGITERIEKDWTDRRVVITRNQSGEIDGIELIPFWRFLTEETHGNRPRV